MADDLAGLALRQLRDYDAACPGSIFGDPEFELTVAAAYELQFQVAALRESRGESVAGYKVGCLSAPVRAQLGLDHPVTGHLFSSELHRSPASLEASRFDHLAIEGEFAFRIGEDVPDAGRLAAAPERAIEAMFPVIELHNHICRASPAMRAPELIANNGLHAGVVMPPEEIRGDPGQLLEERITVARNGVALGTADGSALPGGPLASLVFLARRLEEAGKKLRRGHIVLTGSPLPLYSAEAGDVFEVTCSRLPGVSLRLVP